MFLYMYLQADIIEHEKTRESLTKEMVKLTEENTDLSSKIKQLQKMQQQYKVCKLSNFFIVWTLEAVNFRCRPIYRPFVVGN